MSITIRTGNTSDAEWIARLLQTGARDGHFGPTVARQACDLVKALLDDGFITIVKARGGVQAPRKIHTELWVAEVNGKPASFLVTLLDHEGKEIEVHLAATLKEFRQQGCFSSLIAHVKSRKTDAYRLFARCYEKSSWAMEALLKLGFRKSKEGNPIELSL